MIKKLFATLLVAVIGVSAVAQEKGDVAVGANISYGTEISSPGIGVKGQYNLTDAVRGEASFDYFLENSGMKMFDVCLNLHYLFSAGEKVSVYPLAGLSVTNFTAKYEYQEYDYSDSLSTTKLGVNLGGGVQYAVNEKVNIGLELKYQIISGFDQFILAAGFAYKF